VDPKLGVSGEFRGSFGDVSGTGRFGDGELNPHPNCRSLQLSLILAVSNLGSTPQTNHAGQAVPHSYAFRPSDERGYLMFVR
jgi:hypothetical protein